MHGTAEYRHDGAKKTGKADRGHTADGRAGSPRKQTAKADQKDKTRKESRVRQTGRTEKAKTRQ